MIVSNSLFRSGGVHGDTKMPYNHIEKGKRSTHEPIDDAMCRKVSRLSC